MTVVLASRVCLHEWPDFTITISSVSRSLAFLYFERIASMRGSDAGFDGGDFGSSRSNVA